LEAEASGFGKIPKPEDHGQTMLEEGNPIVQVNAVSV
jgi:hypothetical protein